MRMITAAMALGIALCAAGSNAEARRASDRPLIRVPIVTPDPFWVPDYNVVPRYRYRPEDDRVDTSPYAKPVVPSAPFGALEFGGAGFGW